MNADGVRGICGRCVFRGGTFRTQNALQIPVGQYDCGRCAAQKHTFRNWGTHLPQKVGFALLRSARPTSLHEKQKAPAAAEAFFDARDLMKASFQRPGHQKKRRTYVRRLLFLLVEVVGFEPATPCLQSMCSTS